MKLHIGLGIVSTVDQIKVKGSSGLFDIHKDLKTDTAVRFREGAPRPKPLR